MLIQQVRFRFYIVDKTTAYRSTRNTAHLISAKQLNEHSCNLAELPLKIMVHSLAFLQAHSKHTQSTELNRIIV